jgi:hypothetical protein
MISVFVIGLLPVFFAIIVRASRLRKVVCGNNPDRISVLDRKRPLAASIRGITRKNARENSVFFISEPKKPLLSQPWYKKTPQEGYFFGVFPRFLHVSFFSDDRLPSSTKPDTNPTLCNNETESWHADKLAA